MNLFDEAALFLDEVRETLIDALPLASEWDIGTKAWFNSDTNIVVGEFDAPVIHGAGQLESEVDSQDYSQLFRVIVRYEYERGYTSAPCAHIHYSGVTGLLNSALMQNFQGEVWKPEEERTAGRTALTGGWQTVSPVARRIPLLRYRRVRVSGQTGLGADLAAAAAIMVVQANGCRSKGLP